MGREDDEVESDSVEEPEADGDVDPDDVPTIVVAPGADPMERARQALRNARMARGIDPDAPEAEREPEPPPRDPVARANAALKKAAAAREEAAKGKLALEREARAREELEVLKRRGPAAPDEVDVDAPTAGAPAEPDPATDKPKKRRL